MNGQEFYEKLKGMTEEERRMLVNIMYDDANVVRMIRDEKASRMPADSEVRRRLESMTNELFVRIINQARDGMDEPADWVLESFNEALEDLVWGYAIGDDIFEEGNEDE